MTQLTLALDWTPNINHIGFFVALENGLYHEHGLEVLIHDPSEDNYQITPAKKVEIGEADLALCPTESIISYRRKSRPFSLLGIAAIFQQDLSAIAVQAGMDIISPKDLDGLSYASYRARYEDEIVRQLIKNDGGKGDIRVEYPEKLGIWDTLVSGKYDSTWVFKNWEGVAASAKGIALKYFQLEEYEVPYSYSPVIATSESIIREKGEAIKAFLAATKEGYLFCLKEPETAISILAPHVPESDQHIDLRQALDLSTPAFGTVDSWGKMETDVVETFLSWLKETGLEPQKLTVGEVITNQLLDHLR